MDILPGLVDNLVMVPDFDSTKARTRSAKLHSTSGTFSDSSSYAVSSRGTFFRYFPVGERDRKWGLYVTTLGTSRVAPHSPYPPFAHPQSYHYTPNQTRVLQEFQMTYISQGGGWIETEASGRRRVEAGQLYILFPGIKHRERPGAESGWNEHWIGFDGEIARRLGGFFSPKEPVVKIRHEESLQALYTEAIGAVKTNQPALQQVLAGIVVHMFGLVYSDQNSKIAGDDETMSIMRGAVARMREHLAVPLDLVKLAGELGLSYSTFRHKFAHHTGMSPHQYLLELRLARARTLLTETGLTTKEVAYQCGFEDEHYFSRFFHKKVGAAPNQWRTRARRKG